MNSREKPFTAEDVENAEARTMGQERCLSNHPKFFSAFSAVSVFLFRQGAAWQ
jgi:hypothetical protein